MNVLEEKPMGLHMVREEIDKIKKRDDEPNFRVARLDEYLQHLSQTSATKVKEMINA